MTTPDTLPLLSNFWSPLCAVGSHGGRGPNAQICISVFGASIVPDRPRVTIVLSKTNYTTSLVQQSGTLAVTLLSEDQLDLIEPLGLHSGRDADKLAGIPHELNSFGDPIFPGGVGSLDCEVLAEAAFGDSFSFLCAVRAQREAAGQPLRWPNARGRLPEDVLRAYQEKQSREQAIARQDMVWR